MATRTLEVTLISAHGLKNVNRFSKMEIYAQTWLSSDPCHPNRTFTDRDGGRNPTWNRSFRFSVPSGPDPGRAALHVTLRAHRAASFDRIAGEVRIPLRDLFVGVDDGPGPVNVASFQVRRPGFVKPKGVLLLSYRLGAVIAATPAPAPAPASRESSCDPGSWPSARRKIRRPVAAAAA
ncbi:C2 domain-containing protein [Dioscorea alata]|uniref:C2 domain-containing protein n=1 Tax=Dioscorea alata TaxID=55571 RepID=A0ACB7VQQ7_DIOAL|nr:C2 domain-containing protein [Dioscorea alata]